MTLVALLVARREGFFKAGTLPQRDHNPGDLRHSPHSEHPGDPNAIGVIDNDADGWADLERELRLYAARGVTMGEFVADYAPSNENDTEAYLQFILAGFGGRIDADTLLSEALQVQA